MLEVSFFHSAWDAYPLRRRLSWPALASTLQRFRAQAGEPGDDDAKRACPCWSPAVYPPHTRRAARHVEAVTCFVLDYDDGRTVDEALERWGEHELVLHSSWSHGPDLPKVRVVLPLARPVPGELWRNLYAWALEELDGAQADPKCKDPSRLFFLPAEGLGGPHVALRHRGTRLDLLDEAHEIAAQAQRLRKARAQRARRKAARLPRTHVDGPNAERLARQRLATDPQARRQLGEKLGGRITHRAGGDVIKGVPCPACGRHSVWWPLVPDDIVSGMCEHRNSCGWLGSLFDLGLQTSVAA